MVRYTQVAGVILAGGRSSRMGTDKKDLTLNGKALLHHMVEILKETGIKNIWVSGKARDIPCIPDDVPFCGPVPALYTVMEHLHSYNRFLFVPVDMPFLMPEMLRLLLSAPNGAYFSGFPLPAFVVRQEEKKTDRSVKDFLATMETEPIALPERYKAAMKNINTQKDWEEAQKYEYQD